MLGGPIRCLQPSNIRVVVFSIRGFASGISAIIRTFPSKKYCRSIRKFRSIYNCIFEDPILPKDKNALNSLYSGITPNGDITDNRIWYSGIDKLLQKRP